MQQQTKPTADWDPYIASETGDPRDLYDDMRNRCPVAWSERLQWSVFRYDDIMRILLDHDTFSNKVSRYLTVPNGMDPPEHTAYRDAIVPYFSEERLRGFEPVCRQIVEDAAERVLATECVELISVFALDVSVRIHCAFLGWPASLHKPLAVWTVRGQEAARVNDQIAFAEIAREFQQLVGDMLAQRRESNALPEDDITASLMHDTVFGRSLDEAEIASILRNWTVGEIGTMSASIGILVHYLAKHPDLQETVRADRSLLRYAIDEILRLHGPLVTNRRIATGTTTLGDRVIEAGDRVTINWVSANRDEQVFDNPHEFSFDRDPAKNLLYGAGIHVCPGQELARMELRLVMETLLAKTSHITLNPMEQPVMAEYPASGYATLPICWR